MNRIKKAIIKQKNDAVSSKSTNMNNHHLELSTTAILLIDHGSKKKSANDQLIAMGKKVKAMRPHLIVEVAHMELADPDILTAFTRCVKRGATAIQVFPYMLSEGRHVTEDVPRLVKQAAKLFPRVSYTMLPPFGLHPKIIEIILERANV